MDTIRSSTRHRDARSMRFGHAAGSLHALAVLAVGTGLLAACEGARQSRSRGVRAEAVDPVGDAPGDLSLEIRVVPGEAVEGQVKIEERPARFVLLPDGSLHGEADRIPPDGIRPARIRRLAREQMADVWTTISSLGFASPSLAEASGATSLAEAARDEVLVTAEVHANGDRFVFVRRYRPGSSDEVAIRKLVRSIASLAWASDEALAESAELPLRYDLGPDPYARFAREGRQGGARP